MKGVDDVFFYYFFFVAGEELSARCFEFPGGFYGAILVHKVCGNGLFVNSERESKIISKNKRISFKVRLIGVLEGCPAKGFVGNMVLNGGDRMFGKSLEDGFF